MKLNLLALRREVRNHLGVENTDPEFDDTSLNNLINLSYEDVRTRLKLRDIQRFADISLSAGTGSYNFSSAYAVYGVLIKDNDSNEFLELLPLDAKSYHDSVDSDVDARKIPTHYHTHDGNTIYFSPVPDEAYTVRVMYIDDAADLALDNDTLRNPGQIDEIVMYGAVWRGFVKLNFYEKGDVIVALQDKLISQFVPVQAIEEQDSRFAQLDFSHIQTYNPRSR